MTYGMFDEINALRDIKRRIEEAAKGESPKFDMSDASVLSATIENIVSREKTILTTKAALTSALGIKTLREIEKQDD